MEAMGDKIAARKRMIAAGVPVVPGTEQPLQSAEEAVRICNEIGYPVMLKASMGGGGKGMRLIHNENEELRRERAVELSFEGFRFIDLRRWMLCGSRT